MTLEDQDRFPLTFTSLVGRKKQKLWTGEPYMSEGKTRGPVTQTHLKPSTILLSTLSNLVAIRRQQVWIGGLSGLQKRLRAWKLRNRFQVGTISQVASEAHNLSRA